MNTTKFIALGLGAALITAPLLAHAFGFNMNSDSDDYNRNNGNSWSWGSNTGNRNYQRPLPPQQPIKPIQAGKKPQQTAPTTTQNDGKSRANSSFDMNAPSFSFGNGWNPNYNYQQRPNWGYPPNYAYPQNYGRQYAPQPYQPRFRPAWPQPTPATK